MKIFTAEENMIEGRVFDPPRLSIALQTGSLHRQAHLGRACESAGEKRQLEPGGPPLQLSDTVPLRPSSAVSVKV